MKNQNGFKMDMSEFKGSVIAQLSDLKSDIANIDGKVTAYMEVTNNRINILEVWKTDLMAKVTLIVGAVTLVFTMAWDYIRKKINL